VCTGGGRIDPAGVVGAAREAATAVLGAGDWIKGEEDSFLFLSERSGWKHLYHVDKDGKGQRPVTSGNWELIIHKR
jgi:hypothetical protein